MSRLDWNQIIFANTVSDHSNTVQCTTHSVSLYQTTLTLYQCMTHVYTQCITVSDTCTQCISVSHTCTQCITASHTCTQCTTHVYTVYQCMRPLPRPPRDFQHLFKASLTLVNNSQSFQAFSRGLVYIHIQNGSENEYMLFQPSSGGI